jgi:hypothetical protein
MTGCADGARPAVPDWGELTVQIELATRLLRHRSTVHSGLSPLPDDVVDVLAALDQELDRLRTAASSAVDPAGLIWVARALPGLPGVPASVAPVSCPGCGTRQATVHHIPAEADPGTLAVRVHCGACRDVFDLEATAYHTGLAAGVLISLARQCDRRKPGPPGSWRGIPATPQP